MTYVQPSYVNFGDRIPPADWNQNVVDNIIALKAMIPDFVPPGTLVFYAGAAAPTGWLLCYGQAISRTTYVDLFTAIGTTYGAGDGSTTFNVPDLRGRLPLPMDSLGGTPANRVTATQADNLGQSAGEENHTLTTPEMPSHNHTIPSNGAAGSGGTTIAVVANISSSIRSFPLMDTTGGGGGHNNMPPYITLSFLVKT